MNSIKIEELIHFRKELHRYPELSCEEFKTSERVEIFLQHYKPDILIKKLGGTGIAAVYEGKHAGKTILIRCELDALPIHEINDFEHRSLKDGVSHKCGHDGHATIICGVAALLHQERPERGRVVLLFQPAEENGKGAAAVLADEKFKAIQPDYVFALHNLPGFSENQIVVKNGSFTSAVNSIVIRLQGKTAHAGEPHKGINPALAIAEVTQQLLQLTVSDIRKDEFCLVTPVYTHMGELAYGVSAGEGEVHFTIRCRDNEQMRLLEATAENIVQNIAQKHQLKSDISWTESFFANQNSEQAVAWIREAAMECNLEVFEAGVPFGWGEDFGLFTEKFEGAMFGLGAGENMPALHNPDYDFPDTIISAGIRIFHTILKKVNHV